jgi:hypothetical protein
MPIIGNITCWVPQRVVYNSSKRKKKKRTKCLILHTCCTRIKPSKGDYGKGHSRCEMWYVAHPQHTYRIIIQTLPARSPTPLHGEQTQTPKKAQTVCRGNASFTSRSRALRFALSGAFETRHNNNRLCVRRQGTGSEHARQISRYYLYVRRLYMMHVWCPA